MPSSSLAVASSPELLLHEAISPAPTRTASEPPAGGGGRGGAGGGAGFGVGVGVAFGGDVGVFSDVAGGGGLAVAVRVTEGVGVGAVVGVTGGVVVAVGEAARGPRADGLSPSPPPTRAKPTGSAISIAAALPRASPFHRHGRLQASLNHRAAKESAARNMSTPRSLATCRDYTPPRPGSPSRLTARHALPAERRRRRRPLSEGGWERCGKRSVCESLLGRRTANSYVERGIWRPRQDSNLEPTA